MTDTPKKTPAKKKPDPRLDLAKKTMRQALAAMEAMFASKGISQHLASWEFGLIRSSKDESAAVVSRAVESLKAALMELE